MALYQQLKVSVDPVLAAAFKETCAKAGISMAKELTQFMRAKVSQPKTETSANQHLDTRAKRRRAAQRLTNELAMIRDREEVYMENIPENLHGGQAFEAAEQTIQALEDAICLLEEAY
jgi:hypothetical protein